MFLRKILEKEVRIVVLLLEMSRETLAELTNLTISFLAWLLGVSHHAQLLQPSLEGLDVGCDWLTNETLWWNTLDRFKAVSKTAGKDLKEQRRGLPNHRETKALLAVFGERGVPA